MLIFPKPVNLPTSYLVWYGPFIEHWLFMYATLPLRSIPRVGQRSLSRMMLMLKYLFKVCFDSFEVPALYLVETFP